MRDDGRLERVQDYTNAFLGTFYLILLTTLILIWGVWGYPMALAIGAILHLGIRRWSLRRAAAEAAWDARVRDVLARRRNNG
ncbi:hypothetical protein [Jannaschia donghaensis]|uniref:Uncharacterized protein n=1 Tax=Jannaschia donghaensis TaxID=420998 RepID=A0A0M6YED4_9RHOB|nr:hypothetical protein [Jannaschia donghaensis]CTQ48688.1 hypothetical protein JDO7802_00692 [Jannaschia donghaensis]